MFANFKDDFIDVGGLAFDHAERVIALALLDIAPTREMYAHGRSDFATAYWHWFFLIQPTPLPEKMIGLDPRQYRLQKCTNQAGGAHPFSAEALEEYLHAFDSPTAIHASYEDYRAAASINMYLRTLRYVSIIGRFLRKRLVFAATQNGYLYSSAYFTS